MGTKLSLSKLAFVVMIQRAKLFYISTSGSSASLWLARTLSMHEEIIVSHGSEIPAFANPNDFLEYYIPLLKKSHFLLGAIHMADAHGCRMRLPILNFGGAFAGILRNPIARTCSQFTSKNQKEFQTRLGRERLFSSSKDTAEIHAACLKFLGLTQLQPSQIEFLRATIQTLRNDLDLMCNATPDELFFYESLVSDPLEYRRLCTHISHGRLTLGKSLEEAVFAVGVINPHLSKQAQTSEELFHSLSDDLQAIFTIAARVYALRGGIVKRYLAHGYDISSPLSNELIFEAESVIASLR